MSVTVIIAFCALFISEISGQFDANFTLQNIWGRLPSQAGLRSLIQCISSDGSTTGIRFSRKVNTGQGNRLPPRSQQFLSGRPLSAHILLMPADDQLKRFGAFQCKVTRGGVATEIVTLKLPPEELAEIDAKSPYIVANRGDDVDLEITVQKQLGLTLKWKHNNGQDDIVAWDDKQKVELKNVQESDSGIYECYHEGRRSESLHAIIRLIVRGCPAGFYGENCESECPPCYNGGICHDKLGVCVCPAGFTGENCEQACGGNHFGVDCSKQCTPPQEGVSTDEGCALHLFCKPDPYGCSCAPGFKGSACKDHCAPGWYGADCKQRCHCFYGSSSCNRITGACERSCARGWRGASCQIEDASATPGLMETTTMAYCPVGHYGSSCENDCHCAGNEMCDIVTGHCPSGCEEGWGTRSCSVCRSGRFGDNCESTCHCAGGDHNCDEDGFCLQGCQAGWAGINCQQECASGRFGSNCALVCHCKDGPAACNRFSGFCTGDCVAGFMGEDCQTMCPHDRYGVNCIHDCTCLNGGQCSRVDGTCSCEGRWRGSICNESEPQFIAATDEEVNVGQLAYITCAIDAIPQPIINITSEKFPGLPIVLRTLEQNQYQMVAKVRSRESGNFGFNCTASNQHGLASKVVTLSVIDPPRLLEEPKLQSNGNTSVVVNWKQWQYGKDEGGKNGDSVECTVIHRRIGSGQWIKVDSWKTNLFASVENLEPDTQYEIAVKCRRPGRGGEGQPSPSLLVTTECGDPLPDAIPQGFLQESINSSSVKLTWEHPSETHLKCTLTGYTLEYHLQSTPGTREILPIPGRINTVELDGLNAQSTYVLHLFPVTRLGHSRYFAELIIHTTGSTPNTIRDLVCNSTENPDELYVMWKEPALPKGDIKGYTVTYQITNRGMCKNSSDDPADYGARETVFTSDTGVKLFHLHPYSQYLITVQPKTLAGEGDAVSTTATTPESGPDIGPPNLQLTSKGSTFLEFKWDPIPCELANGIIVEHEYKLVRTDTNELSPHILEKRQVGSDDSLKKVNGLEATIGDLEPYTEYGFAVRANTKAGTGIFSDYVFGKTDEAAPPPPGTLQVTRLTSTSLTVSWIPPDPPLGEITKYRLMCSKPGAPNAETNLTLNTTQLKLDGQGRPFKEISGLKPFTDYLIKVQASTNAGWGEWSDEVSATTLDGVPGLPTNVTLRNSTKTTLEISWEQPVKKNGILTYMITYVPVSSLDPSFNVSVIETVHLPVLEDTSRSIVLTDLNPSTQYAVEITARTRTSPGSPYKLKCWTDIDNQHVVPHVETVYDDATNESIPIIFSTVGKSSVKKYQIIVEDARNKHGIDENLLSDYDTAVVQEGLPYYIAGEIDPNNISDSQNQTFVVGDSKEWGGYKNVHLNVGHEYRIWIRTLVGKDQGTKSFLSDPQQNISVTQVEKGISNDKCEIFGMDCLLFILILASSLVLLVVIIFFTCLYFCRKKERRKVSKSDRNSGVSDSMTWFVLHKVSDSEAADGPLVSEGYKVMHGHENAAMSLKKVKKESKTSIGIKMENFPDYVRNVNAPARLSDEFMRLAAGQTAPWTVARKSENLKKNRYGNILPYDRHRVVLHFDQGGSGSDYINASYIDGYRRPKEYIVTQGPLESTVVDFWRMIWQESVPVIVMVTELVENGKKRCVQYWPDDSMVCGKLQILLIHTEPTTNFVIRTILIRSVEEGKTHRVHQYQFTEWPDRTIPSNPCFLIKMMKRIRTDHPVLGGPMVVHCSAGAGRSGTFVALDALTKQAIEEKRVDVFRFVNCARLQRINLVQTPEQYVFIHEALLEAFEYEDTSVPLERVSLYLKELDNSEEHMSTIQRQYSMLNRTQKKVDVNLCSDALSECNIFKNRDPITVPANSARIVLLESGPEEDYINAVRVNGYRHRDAFIVTQMPLSHTVADFWNLVYQEKSSLLLMLNGCDTEDSLNIGQYWPSRGQETYEKKFDVQVVTFEDQGDVIIRIMRLLNHDQPHDEPHKVIQLQYKAWETDSLPKPASMLKLVNTVELWYGRSSGGPITVHCLDGTTRSGLFCAISYLCGQLKAEGSLDVYQMVKDIRINRPEFLSSMEQYKFCFQVAQELGESITESNNMNTITRKKLTCYV